MGQAKGHAPESINRLLDHAQQAKDQGLPERLIMNKIKEGLAKGASPDRIRPVVRDMVGNLRDAREVLRSAKSGGSKKGDNSRATEVMAEALGRGVTVNEVRSLGRSRGKSRVNQEELAFGAKGLALTKEGGIPGADAIPVVGEALRQGFRSSELLDLGREIKKRGKEFRAHRNRLQDIKNPWKEENALIKFLTVSVGTGQAEAVVTESHEKKIANLLERMTVSEIEEMIKPREVRMVSATSLENEWIVNEIMKKLKGPKEGESVTSSEKDLSVTVSLERVPIFNGIVETGEVILVVAGGEEEMIEV